MSEEQGEGEIYEIRVRKASALTPEAQDEVAVKLKEINDKGKSFNFQGYAKLTYVRASPIRLMSVDPIEGTIVDLFNQVNAQCGINK